MPTFRDETLIDVIELLIHPDIGHSVGRPVARIPSVDIHFVADPLLPGHVIRLIAHLITIINFN